MCVCVWILILITLNNTDVLSQLDGPTKECIVRGKEHEGAGTTADEDEESSSEDLFPDGGP